MQMDPIRKFEDWFEDAKRCGSKLFESATLATATKQGRPSARIVLFKGISEGGFLFFTNYESRKAKELLENPHAALVFYWSALDRQIRIRGSVKKTSYEESNLYFQSRPRESQIAAIASRQSEKLQDREDLLRTYREIEKEFESKEIPCPKNWGGFRLMPEEIEFWTNREFRLHDRELFTRKNDQWTCDRLFP